jgi:hypothetical protein
MEISYDEHNSGGGRAYLDCPAGLSLVACAKDRGLEIEIYPTEVSDGPSATLFVPWPDYYKEDSNVRNE